MSLILDALKKSERSRQQSLSGRLGAGEAPPARTRLPVPWVTLLGVVLLVNAVVLGLLFFSPPASLPQAAPAPSAVPAAASPSPASVRPLAQEAAPPSPPTAALPGVSPAPGPTLPASAASGLQPVVAANAAALPSYDSLTPDQRQGLPALHMDVHGYANKPADRFVVINLKRYRIGDVLAEGPTVKDILPEGAVLEYRGTLFLLPAT